MVDINESESELLAQVVAAGVARLYGSRALVARRLALLGLLRAIAARRRHALPYYVANGAGIAALNAWTRARELRRGCTARHGGPAANLPATMPLELDQCAVGTWTATRADGAHPDP
jgi:hypothetical protein